MMDGRLITEERTAAVSAVATKFLARQDASILALIGSGVQAKSHLKALGQIGTFREVRVWSPRSAAAFAEEFDVVEARSAEDAVRGASVMWLRRPRPRRLCEVSGYRPELTSMLLGQPVPTGENWTTKYLDAPGYLWTRVRHARRSQVM
jgi:hypothetical protein